MNMGRIITLSVALMLSPLAHAGMIEYKTWETEPATDSGNYIFTVTQGGGFFNYNLTVNPWNAEALGLFIDFGNVDLGVAANVTNEIPSGEVSLFAQDTMSNDCGAGCTLQGPFKKDEGPGVYDNEWELVFSLADQGWDNIQTFSWTTQDFGLALSDFGLVGIRSQQLCSGNDLLPGDEDDCDGSDKSYSGTPVSVPEPATIALFALGLLGLGLTRVRAKS